MTVTILSTRRRRWRYRRRGWWLSLRWSTRPPWRRWWWCKLPSTRHQWKRYGFEYITIACERCEEVLRDA